MWVLHLLAGIILVTSGLKRNTGARFHYSMGVITQETGCPWLQLTAIIDKHCGMLSIGQSFRSRLIIMRLCTGWCHISDTDFVATNLPGEVVQWIIAGHDL